DIWDYFGSLAFPREEVVRQVLDALSVDQAQRLKTLMTKVELRRNRLLMVLGVLEVDGVVARGRNGWISTGATWSYDAQRYEGLEAARGAEQQAMIDYQHTDGCRMEFLRRQLDDPDLTDGPNRCGRCDNCTTG
ncbi:MAG: recombinase RecQ, partial [Pseudonocardiaceae bacterium]